MLACTRPFVARASGVNIVASDRDIGMRSSADPQPPPRVNSGARRLGYFFAALIVVFAVLSVAYLIANDFARETHEVVFPAIGAILLSSYLGVKTIWIDNPGARRSQVPIAVLHDPVAGAVSSMVVAGPGDQSEEFQKFAGIRLLDSLPIYNAFESLHLEKRLAGAHDDATLANPIVADLVEYAVLQWLATPDTNIGWDDLGTIHMLQGSVGGGGIPDTYQAVDVEQSANDANELLTLRPIQIRLPRGSSVIRTGGPERFLELNTPHSYLRIRLSVRGGSTLNASFRPAISTLLGLHPNSRRWIVALMAKVETGQHPLGRFSRQAKLEAVWLDRVHSRFEGDFSWDLLRARLYRLSDAS